MTPRTVIAAVLVFTLLTARMQRAHAQETPVRPTTPSPEQLLEWTPGETGRGVPNVLALTSEVLTLRTSERLTRPAQHSPFWNAGTEIRLSRGAKTAIIVTAIVVGALLIIGVIALGKPHKHL